VGRLAGIDSCDDCIFFVIDGIDQLKKAPENLGLFKKIKLT
jgi:hypothetical protein